MKTILCILFLALKINALPAPSSWEKDVDSDEIKDLVKRALLKYNKEENKSDYVMTLQLINKATYMNSLDQCLYIDVTLVSNSNCLKSNSLECDEKPKNTDPIKQITIRSTMEDNPKKRQFTFSRMKNNAWYIKYGTNPNYGTNLSYGYPNYSPKLPSQNWVNQCLNVSKSISDNFLRTKKVNINER